MTATLYKLVKQEEHIAYPVDARFFFGVKYKIETSFKNAGT